MAVSPKARKIARLAVAFGLPVILLWWIAGGAGSAAFVAAGVVALATVVLALDRFVTDATGRRSAGSKPEQ